MPFAEWKAGQMFQRFMDQVLWSLPYCVVYMDNLLISSASHEEHLEHLEAVFKWLEDHGLVISFSKCIFLASSVTFLGHNVDTSGIRTLPEKVDAITKLCRVPDTACTASFSWSCKFLSKIHPSLRQYCPAVNRSTCWTNIT